MDCRRGSFKRESHCEKCDIAVLDPWSQSFVTFFSPLPWQKHKKNTREKKHGNPWLKSLDENTCSMQLNSDLLITEEEVINLARNAFEKERKRFLRARDAKIDLARRSIRFLFKKKQFRAIW